MRIARFTTAPGAAPIFGELRDSLLHPIVDPFAGGPAPAGGPWPLGAVKLLSPSVPTKIIALARNYRAHAAELANAVPEIPMTFLKPPSAVIAHGEPIVLPPGVGRIDFEGELVLVIGRRGRHLSRAASAQAILGVTCGNDVSARRLQKEDLQWTRGKGFDTFAAVGPFLATGLAVDDLGLETRLNGETRQRGRTREMIFDAARLVEFCSSVMTLEPGDLIYTGTPSGVGELHPGDVVEVEIEGVGTLENPVVAEAPAQ